jgi:hypothetical protein
MRRKNRNMKKLLVLSALLGLLALPVFAEHVTLDNGGDMEFGFITDFSAAEVAPDLTWDVIVGIDDYNSFTWSLAGLDAAPAIELDKALVTTDIGMWAGIDVVGLKVMWGWDDPDVNNFHVVSGYESEDVADFSPDEYWGLGFMVSASNFEVELAFNPIGSSTLGGGYLLAGVAAKEPIPGLNAEFYYFQKNFASGLSEDLGLGEVAFAAPAAGDEFDTGQILLDAGYATEVAGIGLETGFFFWYNLEGDVEVDADPGPAVTLVDVDVPDYYYGLGVAGTYDKFKVTAALNGYEDEALDALSFTVDVDPIDMVTIYAGAAFSLAADDAFQGADIGVNPHIGIVEMYVGYLITSENGGDYNAPETLEDGGFYIDFDVDY